MKRFLGVLFGIMIAVGAFSMNALAVADEPWFWPIPSSTTINWGYTGSDHLGIDIGANIGAPIYAPTDGTIYKKYTGCVRYGGLGTPCNTAGAGCNPNHGFANVGDCVGYCNFGYGNGICLKTSDGYYVQFCHMQSVNDSLYEGQHVSTGTLLGYVGGSGYATGKHCHYQVGTSEFGGTINPQSISYVYNLKDAMKINNEGDLFYGYLVVTKPWMHIVMNKDTGNVELEPNQAARRTAQGCWRFERQSDGSYIITSIYNGKVLDVYNAASADGTNVGVFTRWGDDNAAQRWFLCKDRTIATKVDLTKRLDVTGGSMVAGSNIQIYSANGSDAQFIYPYKLSADTDVSFPTGMTVDSELIVPEGEEAAIHSTFTPQNSPDIFWGINWSSSDESVATVDNNGVVTGIRAGKATISAVSTFNDNWVSQCEVTVGSLIQVPEISSLNVTGYNVDLSWEASPLSDENDERTYEVNVYKKDALEVPEQTFTGLTGTDLQFTVDTHGDYVVTVTAVNATDDSRSKDASRSFIVLDENWIYYDELPDDLPECEIQYLNHYDSVESAQSPGEGWIRGNSRKIYTDTEVMYSPDPNPLQESDTLVLLGTYYYHYCNRSGRVEHYRTDSYNHEVILDNWNGRFEVVWQGADDNDSRYTVYRLKWLEGDYAGYPATCSEGSDLYYRGYRYQKKSVTTVYTWTKEESWSDELDPEASSVSYRVREVTYENSLALPAGTERIEEEAFMNSTLIEEVIIPDGCVSIESRAFAGCTGLKRVYIPKNAEVADNAFDGCDQLVIIRY